MWVIYIFVLQIVKALLSQYKKITILLRPTPHAKAPVSHAYACVCATCQGFSILQCLCQFIKNKNSSYCSFVFCGFVNKRVHSETGASHNAVAAHTIHLSLSLR